MEQQQYRKKSSSAVSAAATVASNPTPVRSRWTPKPEQILILESIFNSGMVNPPKDETVRIRKLLEKFGAVGDANVFYWFQNRRSRSRRRQRQLQAAVLAGGGVGVGGGSASAGSGTPEFVSSDSYYPVNCCWASSSGLDAIHNYNNNNNNNNNLSDLFHFPTMAADLDENPKFFFEDSSALQTRQPEVITVFINGVAMEIAGGPMEVKATFGGDFALVHCSGTVVPVDEYGFLAEGLRDGESYFLVPGHSQI